MNEVFQAEIDIHYKVGLEKAYQLFFVDYI